MTVPVGHHAKTTALPAPEQWPLRGGAFCLDFANTVGWRPTAFPVDALPAYDDLVRWARHAGLLSTAEAERGRRRATADAGGARAALADAVALREATHRLFAALAHGDAPAPDDLATISVALSQGLSRAALAPADVGFVIRYGDDDSPLALPLWKLADSAAQLLVSGDWRRVRECPGRDCGWLFLDRTKNGNRRWCDSDVCGNRARVRAHYQRSRAAGTTAAKT